MKLLTIIAAALLSISAYSQEKKSNQDGLIESVEELSSLEKDTGSNISLGDIGKSSSSKRVIEINTRPLHYLVGSINIGTEFRAYKNVSIVLDGSYGNFLWGGPVTSVMGGIRYYFQELPYYTKEGPVGISYFVSIKHRSGFYASDAFYWRSNAPSYGRRNTLMLGAKLTTARHFTAAYEIGIQNQDFYINKGGNAFGSPSVNRVSAYFTLTFGYKFLDKNSSN